MSAAAKPCKRLVRTRPTLAEHDRQVERMLSRIESMKVELAHLRAEIDRIREQKFYT